MAKRKKESVLSSEGIQRLLEGDGKKLSRDEMALLLAMIGVDANTLNEEEQEALDKLKGLVEGYDPDELTQAVQHMVTAEAVKSRKTEWPELKKRRQSKSSKK